MGEERGEVEEEVGEELAVVRGRLTGEVSSVAYFTWTSADSAIVQFEGSCMKNVSGRNTVHASRHIQIFSYNECKQT